MGGAAAAVLSGRNDAGGGARVVGMSTHLFAIEICHCCAIEDHLAKDLVISLLAVVVMMWKKE